MRARKLNRKTGTSSARARCAFTCVKVGTEIFHRVYVCKIIYICIVYTHYYYYYYKTHVLLCCNKKMSLEGFDYFICF